jgi:signal transduction histidine kinase
MDTSTLENVGAEIGEQRVVLELAALLDHHRDELVDAWIALKRQLPNPRYQGQPPEQLRTTTLRQLSAVIEILTLGPDSAAGSALAGICHIYQQADLAVTVEACLLLKEAALPFIRRAFSADEDAAWKAIARLDSCLRWIVGQHTKHYAVDTHRRLQTQQTRAMLILEMAQTMGESPGNGSKAAEENGRLPQYELSLAALEERDRLAREMHDNLSQALGILKMRLAMAGDLLAKNQIEQVRMNLSEMKEIAAEAYTDAREVIFSLRSPTAAGSNFLPLLARYLFKYRASYGVNVQLDAMDTITDGLTVQTATQVIRIIQEALTNVRKHARARQVCVRVVSEDNQLRITIEDDGQGFDPVHSLLDGAYGFGLRVMQERAESVGGRLEIDAHMGRGTRIGLWVPLSSGEDQ